MAAEASLGVLSGKSSLSSKSIVNSVISTSNNFIANEYRERELSSFLNNGMSTRFSAYGLNATAIPAIVEKLKQHGRLKLGEHGDITPDDVAQLLQLAL
jgi:NADP-dependent alcohol dehydrogenase